MGSGRQQDRDYLQGRSSITNVWNGPRGKQYVKVVDPSEVGTLSKGPERELGNPFIFDAGARSAWQAYTDFATSQNISIFARVSAMDSEGLSESPFAVLPDFTGANLTPFGGVVPLGHAQFGYEGCTFDWFFNMLVGGFHRVSGNGSTCRFAASMTPKYFLADDTSAAVRVYDTTAGNMLDSSTWNTPTPSLTQQVLGSDPSQAAIFTRKAVSHAWAGYGANEVDVSSRTVRKFFGSVPPMAGARARSVICPVAWGADHVELVGGNLRGASPVALEFWQVGIGYLDLVNAIGLHYIGPFPAVTAAGGLPQLPVQMIDGCEFIAVTCANAGGFAGDEVTFEVNYYLGA